MPVASSLSPKIVGWRVWYSDHSVSSKETTWDSLPDDDVQVVMLYYYDGTRRIMQGNDYYWRWQSDFGMVYAQSDVLPDPLRYPGATVKRGKWTSDENLDAISNEAMASKWL